MVSPPSLRRGPRGLVWRNTKLAGGSILAWILIVHALRQALSLAPEQLAAMGAGLPIVATPVGGTPMQVGADGARLLVPVGDADQLADRLLMMIDQPDLRRAIGCAMRKRVLEHFDIDRIADRYICAYRKLISGEAFDLRDCGTLPDGEGACAA